MTQETCLIRQRHLDITIDNYTLATKARINARVNRPVDEILFLVRYFLDVIHPFVHINVAGAAAAYAAAVVLQFNAVLQANVKHRFPFGYRQLYTLQPLLLKVYLYFKNVHCRKSNKITIGQCRGLWFVIIP